jgi:hypothetical protein
MEWGQWGFSLVGLAYPKEPTEIEQKVEEVAAPIIEQIPLPPPPVDTTQERVVEKMELVIDAKVEASNQALADRTGKGILKEVVLIGGDVFTVGYMGFTAITLIKPLIAKVAAVGIATLICGEIAGVINMGVACVSLVEGIQALKNGDWKLAARLLIDFAFCFVVGLIMVFSSTLLKGAVFGALALLIASNPWLLPVLFLILAIPVSVELAHRLNNTWKNKDLGSLIKNGQFETILNLNEFKGKADLEISQILSNKMERLQEDMGVEAALETMLLLHLHLTGKDTTEQKKRVEKKLAEWNYALYVRAAQQFLFFIAFIVSMGALKASVRTSARLNGATNFAMAGANGIPLYMDTYWPFKRNAPIVVPKIEYS